MRETLAEMHKRRREALIKEYESGHWTPKKRESGEIDIDGKAKSKINRVDEDWRDYFESKGELG